jgi:RNA polymerase subunit RPABC4/transcription elongation factor Spt4
MKTCKDCGKEISNTARRCPNCGAYHWSDGRIALAIFMGVFLLIFIIGMARN